MGSLSAAGRGSLGENYAENSAWNSGESLGLKTQEEKLEEEEEEEEERRRKKRRGESGGGRI